jgi:hypothetical protein
MFIGGQEVRSNNRIRISPPHDHGHLLGHFHKSDKTHVEQAINAALEARGLNKISGRCCSVFRYADAPNLFLLAPGVLEANTSTPWAYSHVAKSIMSHIAGRPVFTRPPRQALTNHFEIVKMLASHDRSTYPFGLWYGKYLWLAMFHPRARPMPIP